MGAMLRLTSDCVPFGLWPMATRKIHPVPFVAHHMLEHRSIPVPSDAGTRILADEQRLDEDSVGAKLPLSKS